MNRRFLMGASLLGIILGDLHLFSKESITQMNDGTSTKNKKSSLVIQKEQIDKLDQKVIGLEKKRKSVFPSGNPISPNKNSLSRGKTLYINKCQSCHGALGRGDGVFARSIKNMPDLSDPKMWSKSDQELFNIITVGAPPMMPAYHKTIKEEDRWNLVNYIRTFAPKPKIN